MKKYYIFIFSAITAVTMLSGQNISPRISGLENDSVYMSLLLEEKILKNKEDSLSVLLDTKRSDFMRDTSNRSVRGAEILSLEAQLFDTRNNLGVVVSRTNIIEQEYLINSLGNEGTLSGNGSGPTGTDNRFLPYNIYIRNNLDKEEYDLLLECFKANNDIRILMMEFSGIYDELEELPAQYAETEDQNSADSLFTRYRNLRAKLMECEEIFSEKWDFIFNSKSYIYTILLDKLNKLGELNDVNRRYRADKIASDELKNKISVTFAEFPAQYRLISEYEILLAESLNLTNALDSLKHDITSFQGDKYIKDNILLSERDFVDYSGISKVTPYPYSNQNPIPELHIPDKGKFYSITVGTFSTRPAVSTFKNIIPVYNERVQGRYRYYIGLYKTLSDAYADALALKNEYGFRKPEVVVWNNGEYTNLGSELDKNIGSYHVELEGIDKISESLREYVNSYATDKDVTFVNGKYFIGIFSNKLLAEEFAEVLNTLPDITASVSEIE
ncbi:MAG: SPOR domain-containing protein [Rikenellaceae bacterium]|nr:SPOR domain-containing protein [Rikenellaceae bacterium]